jgi:uncharacterized delta-60 repeat protein
MVLARLSRDRIARILAGLSVTVAMALLSENPTALARPGELDPSFGSGGKVTTQVGDSVAPSGLALQADGRLVAVGATTTRVDEGLSGVDRPSHSPADFALIRYNPDGSLDSTFGDGGIVSTDFLGGDDLPNAVAVQEDGKILVAGSAWNGRVPLLCSHCQIDPNVRSDFAVARYRPDGGLDETFGTGGKVITELHPQNTGESREPLPWSMALSLAVQPDGKIVAAGMTAQNLALVRYNPDGSLDDSFGNNGVVATSVGEKAVAESLIIQGDGRLVVAGLSVPPFRPEVGVSISRMMLARYNPDGTLDSSFGEGGIVTPSLRNHASAVGIVMDRENALVVAGTYGPDIMVARYTPDGSLDASFGSGGLVFADLAGRRDRAVAVGLTANDLIMVCATAETRSNGEEFALVRYNRDGSLDSTFGDGGKAITAFGTWNDSAKDMVAQPDGKIAILGSSTRTPDVVLVRFLAD